MADGEHTSMDLMQPLAPEPVLDRAASDAKRSELPARHDAVLARCKRGDLGIAATRPWFCLHDMLKCGLVRHATEDRRNRVLRLRRTATIQRKRSSNQRRSGPSATSRKRGSSGFPAAWSASATAT